MHGKALVLSALLLALDISSTSAQSLFEQRIKCQKIAEHFPTSKSPNIREKYTSNFDAKNGHCYVLYQMSFTTTLSYTLYDGITSEMLASSQIITKNDGTIHKIGQIHDKSHTTSYTLSFENTEKYIADKMKTER